MSDSIQQMFDAAVAKDKGGEGSEALNLLDTLIEYQPGHRLGLFYRGGVKLRYRKDVEGALRDWEAAFEGAPPGSSARVRDMFPLFLESCLERLMQLAGQHPDNALYHSGLGRANLIFDQPELGERHLYRAMQLDVSRGIDGVRLAQLLIRKGKNDKATEVLQKQLSSVPEDPHILAELGLLLRSRNLVAQALRHLETASRLNPHHLPTRQALGEIYLSQGRMDLAESHFRFILEHQPTAAAYLALAACDKEQFRYEEALQNKQKASQLEPGNFQSWAKLGELSLQMGLLDEGIEALRKALSIEANHPEILGLLAKAALQKGDRQQAIAALRSQLKLEPGDAFASYTLASELRATGSYAEAAELLKTALQVRAGDVQLCLDLAECYVEMGQLPAATELLKEAYQRNPNREDLRAALAEIQPELLVERQSGVSDSEQQLNLARAHLQAGRSQEAFEALRQVLTANPRHGEALLQLGRLYASRKAYEHAAEFLMRSFAADASQLTVLLELFSVLNQMAGKPAYAALDQLARVVPENLDWLEFLWNQRQAPGVDRLLPPLVQATQKVRPQHPACQRWTSLQLA